MENFYINKVAKLIKTCYNIKTMKILREFLQERINKKYLSDIEVTFKKYRDFLQYWNENKSNLTRITNFDDVEIKHFIDSLTAIEFIPKKAKVLDVGSGAGFPGLPIKIVRDDLDVTLIDSVKKKVDFMNELISLLSLDNVVAKHTRIEDIEEKNSFDVVVSRAVAPLPTLMEYCLPFVKKQGLFIAYKSVNVDDEIKESQNALKVLNGEIEQVKKFELKIKYNSGESESNKRALIIVRKNELTPNMYPRKKNLPRTKPL